MFECQTPSAPDGIDESSWNVAISTIREWCGWHISPEIVSSFIVDGSGTQTLLIPSLKVNDVLEVIEDGVSLPVGSLEWSEDGRIRHPNGLWTSRLRGVKVVVRHGYVELPGGLKGVAMEAANRGIGTTTVKVGEVEMTSRGVAGAASFLLPHSAILSEYRFGESLA